MRKYMLIILITAVMMLTACGKEETFIPINHNHTDSFIPMTADKKVDTDDNTDNSTGITVIYTDAQVIEQLKNDTEEITASVEDTLGKVPDVNDVNESEFDTKLTIDNNTIIDEDKLFIFIMGGYGDDILHMLQTFIDNYNITTEIQFSDKITNIRMDNTNMFILHANEKDFILCYNNTTIYIKEIQ